MFPDGLIEINGKSYITLYGICIAIGIVACIVVLRFLGKKLNVDRKFIDAVETTAYAAILVGFLSAAVFQGFYNWRDGGKFTLTGGITFLGGLIGGVVTFLGIYFITRNKLTGRVTDILPIAPACITIAHAFGRLGCFFAGCCGGIQTDSWLGIKFPGDFYKVYPTQLFEAIFLFILFAVIFILVYKKNFKYTFVIYLASYGVWRFLLEYIRGDDRGQFIGNISPSQFWSLLMVVLAIPMFFLLKYLNKERAKELQLEREKELQLESENE